MLQSCLAAAAPALLLLPGLLSSGFANRHVSLMRGMSLTISGLALLCSAASVAMLPMFGSVDMPLLKVSWPVRFSPGVYLDSLSAIMMLLITFIGLVIVRYSVRYQDRDETQGRFLKWILTTLGAVLLLVVSRDLIMLTASWMLTSFSLHKLLTHYPDRSWATWAARKKFLISRFGDAMLLTALGLTYACFGSVEYSEIFAGAQSVADAATAGSFWIPIIGSLYVLGAMTKSAQFPFHSWLPDTMETPTPVSALMHAGIINAGGFLVLRLSPLIASSHLALDVLALVGGFTALLGAVVMLTQTSVKRQIAYSTIAQMGFMMLQCGLGAFSAALLHIVAHSPAALILAVSIYAVVGWSFTASYLEKPGALVLGLVLSIALTQLLWSAFSAGSLRVAGWGIIAAIGVSVGYYGAYVLTDLALATSVSHLRIVPSLFDSLVTGLVAAGFVGIFLLQAATRSGSQGSLVRSLYVHAANGFYLDVPARRITAWAWGHGGPVQ